MGVPGCLPDPEPPQSRGPGGQRSQSASSHGVCKAGLNVCGDRCPVSARGLPRQATVCAGTP